MTDGGETADGPAAGVRVGAATDADSHLPSDVEAVREALVSWYEAGHRDYPWRETTDPYAILVSEVMSQQTQLDRVLEPWREFLDRWRRVKSPMRYSSVLKSLLTAGGTAPVRSVSSVPNATIGRRGQGTDRRLRHPRNEGRVNTRISAHHRVAYRRLTSVRMARGKIAPA